jgi:hypothetical protein
LESTQILIEYYFGDMLGYFEGKKKAPLVLSKGALIIVS